MVTTELLDPESEFLICERSLSAVTHLGNYLTHLGKHYKAGDVSAVEPMIQAIEGVHEIGERYPYLLRVAYFTDDPAYAYRALSDWLSSPHTIYRVEWGTVLLKAIYALTRTNGH
jgi:hypothetical protein